MSASHHAFMRVFGPPRRTGAGKDSALTRRHSVVLEKGTRRSTASIRSNLISGWTTGPVATSTGVSDDCVVLDCNV